MGSTKHVDAVFLLFAWNPSYKRDILSLILSSLIPFRNAMICNWLAMNSRYGSRIFRLHSNNRLISEVKKVNTAIKHKSTKQLEIHLHVQRLADIFIQSNLHWNTLLHNWGLKVRARESNSGNLVEMAIKPATFSTITY